MMEYLSGKIDIEKFKKTKRAFYSRLLSIFYRSGGVGADTIVKGKVCANCSHHLEDFPMPFSCKHLEISISPKQIQDGKEGVFICERSGRLCELCDENFDGTLPEYCILKKKE